MNNPPKILAYCALHYGVEYISEAIRAVEPFVDKIILLYSKNPSYGRGTPSVCPDSEQELNAIANQFAKVQWIEVKPCHEGNHRGNIFNHAAGYDGILVFDADEVYDSEDLPKMIEHCHNSTSFRFGVNGFINFWRSFNHVCNDHFQPIRYFNLNNNPEQPGYETVNCKIYHFGCAQSLDIMRYKLEIHGHFDELRKNWINDVYLAWEPGKEIPGGLHLTAWNPPLWQASPFDRHTLPELLRNHPNFTKETIL